MTDNLKQLTINDFLEFLDKLEIHHDIEEKYSETEIQKKIALVAKIMTETIKEQFETGIKK